MMKLISINLGQERQVPKSKSFEFTGIYKLPVNTPVQITTEGLTGDTVCDQKHHAGPDQAVYIYGEPDYAWWEEALGVELAPGTFGDNLTIAGLESARFNIGDRLHIGGLVLEVTAPRIPCSTLARRMGDPEFVKKFRAAERPGLYCRVIREGRIQAGDEVIYEPYTGETIEIIRAFRDRYEPELNEAALRSFIAAPIAIRMRAKKEAQLAELLA
jgi:MOSC domain-containing protein YiiM